MMMEVQMQVPEDFELRDAICSYGFYMCAPNRWSEATGRFSRPLHVPWGDAAVGRFEALLRTPGGEAGAMAALATLTAEDAAVVGVEARQGGAGRVVLSLDRAVGATQAAVLRLQVQRILRLEHREQEAQRAFARAWCERRCALRGPGAGAPGGCVRVGGVHGWLSGRCFSWFVTNGDVGGSFTPC
jgi:hypothetical protein